MILFGNNKLRLQILEVLHIKQKQKQKKRKEKKIELTELTLKIAIMFRNAFSLFLMFFISFIF